MNLFVSRILDLLCPAICPVCGKVSGGSNIICPTCETAIVTLSSQMCPRCGAKERGKFLNLIGCPRCNKIHFRFKQAVALGEYNNDLQELVLQMKTDKAGVLAAALMDLFVRYRKEELQTISADWIVPIPRYCWENRHGGVNSPVLLAGELSRLLKKPVMKYLLKRIRHTEMQRTLETFEERWENVKDAFALRHSFLLRRFPNLSGKRILLVDDILTSGATCSEAAKVLLEAGAKRVFVAAIARAGAAVKDDVDKLSRHKDNE